MKKQIEIIDEYSDEEIMATAYVFIEFVYPEGTIVLL